MQQVKKRLVTPQWPRMNLIKRYGSANNSRTGGVLSVKHELEALFAPYCKGVRPSVVEANVKIKADYAFSSAIEIFRANKGEFANAQDVAKHVVASIGASSPDAILSVSNFYVNITLSDDLISRLINARFLSDFGIPPPKVGPTQKVIVDYSSPNIAKQMHVGHLRSTIIGNSIANMYEYVGHDVIRVNHLGDWGTQFGTLLQYFRELWGVETKEKLKVLNLGDITRLYRDAKARFEKDKDFAQRARQCTVKLQSGNDEILTELWKYLVKISMSDFDKLYQRLGVARDKSWYLGESFYQDKVQVAIKDLERFTTTSPNDASVLLYTGSPEAKFASSKPGEPDMEIPLILQKSDGGIGYDATDVAAIRYRLLNLGAHEVIYVTDSGQALHFHLVFQAAKLAGWTRPQTKLNHIAFGIVTKNASGRIRTREGDAETLDELLNKARTRISMILESKRSSWSEDERHVLRQLAEKCGVTCVVMSELKTHRSSDYEFSVERMCNPDGNSGLFVIHVLRKTRRVLSKHKDKLDNRGYNACEASPKERALALDILKFHDVVEQSLLTHSPNILAMHLLSLASKTSSLVEDSKEGLNGKDAHRMPNQLALIKAAENTMLQYFKLLGMFSTLCDMDPQLAEMSKWSNADAIL